MKILLRLSLFTFLIFALSCTKRSNDLDNLYTSEKIDNTITKEVAANYQNSIFLDGKFKISEPNENQIAIYTESADTKHLFLINSDNKTNLLKQNIKSIAYLKNGILINKDLFYGVEGNVNDRIISDVKLLSNKTEVNSQPTINGLVHLWFSKTDSTFKTKTAEQLINTMANFVPEEDCDAGGVGSTGCSIGGGASGCSVSCGSGYHACCNVTVLGANDCHCEAN